MRYKKDCIYLQPRDLAIMKLIVRARFMTRPQLIRIYDPKNYRRSYITGMHSVVRRLIQGGLIQENVRPLMERFLTVPRHGLNALIKHDAAFAMWVQGVKIRPANPNSRFLIHDLMLTELWKNFVRSDQLVRWISSFEIDLSTSKRRPYTYKRYDAIADIKTDEHIHRIGIELERWPKSESQYFDDIYAIQRDTHIPLVLYICSTDELKDTLVRLFREVPKVFFTTEQYARYFPMKTFSEQYRLDGSYVFKPLEEILRNYKTGTVRSG